MLQILCYYEICGFYGVGGIYENKRGFKVQKLNFIDSIKNEKTRRLNQILMRPQISD